MSKDTCPYCELDSYEYVDNGICLVPLATNCCEFGYYLFHLRMSKMDVDKLIELRDQMDRLISKYKNIQPGGNCG